MQSTACRQSNAGIRAMLSIFEGFFNDRASGLAKVRNISLGGCRTESRVVIALNEVGQLLIELPGSHPVKVSHAIVRWILGKECRIEFLKMDAHEQGWLNTIIRKEGKTRGGLLR